MKILYFLFSLILILNITCRNRDNEKNKESAVGPKSLVNTTVSYDSINPLIYPDSLRRYVVKANRLKRFYITVLDNQNQNESEKYESLFYEEFPSDFKTFEIIYCNGMFDYGLQNLLIAESENHVHYFLTGIKSIGTKVIYNKVIGLVNQSKWDPDDSLQDQLLVLTTVDINSILSVLEERSEEEIVNFFVYLFNGPHPLEKLPQEFYTAQKEYSRIVSLAEEGLKKVHVPE